MTASPPGSPDSPGSPASTVSSSYAGSAASIDIEQDFPIQTVTSQLEEAFSPLPLDRALAAQAQLSGLLNSATHDLDLLTEKAIERLPTVKDRASYGKQLLKQINADLDWLQKKVASIEARARVAHPIEYAAAKDRIRPGAL